MTFRQTCVLAMAIFCAAQAAASSAGDKFGKAVELQDQETFATKNVHGKCGNAFVNISGIEEEDFREEKSAFLDNQDAFVSGRNGFVSGAAEVVVIVGKQQKREVIYLSEQSLVRCVATKAGKRLLIGTACTGNSPMCASPEYFVIDAEKISNIDTKHSCDAKCANKKLGMEYIKPE